MSLNCNRLFSTALPIYSIVMYYFFALHCPEWHSPVLITINQKASYIVLHMYWARTQHSYSLKFMQFIEVDCTAQQIWYIYHIYAVHYSTVHYKVFVGQCQNWSWGKCCWGNSFSTDSICFTRANCIGFTTLQSGIWIVSERQRCLRMVRDGCGGRWWWHPGKLPTSWKAPQSSSGGRTGRTPLSRSRCGKLLDRDADSRNFRHFPVSSESQQPVFNMTNCETWFRWKPKNRWKRRGGKQGWSDPDILHSSKQSQPDTTFTLPKVAMQINFLRIWIRQLLSVIFPF